MYEGSQIDQNVKTPLNKQLDTLAGWITKASYVIATLIIVGRLAVFFSSGDTFEWGAFGEHMLSTIMIAVTILVVAVPEGLPMSVTPQFGDEYETDA